MAKPKPKSRKRYTLVARVQIETAIVEHAPKDNGGNKDNKRALALAKKLPDEAWDQPGVPPWTEMVFVCGSMTQAGDTDEGPVIMTKTKVLEEVAESLGDYQFALLVGNIPHGEGSVVVPSWLHTDRENLLLGDITRDWLEKLAALGLHPLAGRIDELLSGEKLLPSDKLRLAALKPSKEGPRRGRPVANRSRKSPGVKKKKRSP